MPEWLDRLMGKTPPRPDPAALLPGYPPYRVPHVGMPDALSMSQARENLAFLLAHKDDRLAILSRLLLPKGIDIGPALNGGERKPLMEALHRWTLREWPALRGPKRPTLEQWLRSSRVGPDIAYSMLADVAILLGELVTRRRASIHWGLDAEEEGESERLISFGRPILMARSPVTGRPLVVLDVEAMAFERFAQIDSPIETKVDRWSWGLDEATSGAYERI